MSDKVKDHMGNEFFSVVEMCLYWGIGTSSFYSRRELGWSLEDSLTLPITRLFSECTDHKGNKFDGTVALCHAYGIGSNLFRRRLCIGWSLEEALTKDVSEQSGIYCTDHLGQTFNSVSAMCRYWHIDSTTYKLRIDSGWTVEEALTKPTRIDAFDRTDHLGREYSTVRAMCYAWGVDPGLYYDRRSYGWSLEDSLTKEKSFSVGSIDHLGKKYSSVKDMCQAWGINDCAYRARIKLGWSLERALTEPTHSICVDPLGTEFSKRIAMIRYWGVLYPTYWRREQAGKSLSEALASKPYNLPTTSISNLPTILNSYDLVKSYINFDIESTSEKEFKYLGEVFSLAFLNTECPMYLYGKDGDELLVVFSESKDNAEVFLHKPEEAVVHACFITKDV